MKPMLNRILKTVCVVVAAGMLTACGSSSTVDPFKPTRVIGLGDAYNDMSNNQATVRGTAAQVGAVTTVVEQVAALFGGGAAVSSKASSTYPSPQTLTQQANALGALTSTDLIVITAGTTEFMTAVNNATSVTTAASSFVAELRGVLNILKAKGATHILVMPVVDIGQTGTADFNGEVLSGLGGYASVMRYASNVARPIAFFPDNLGWAANGRPGATPFCHDSSNLNGCGFADAGNSAGSVSNYFLADDLHPTPAGNRWLAQFLYNVTAQGWR
jgi:phospholipase/lecithinase/hemolysin